MVPIPLVFWPGFGWNDLVQASGGDRHELHNSGAPMEPASFDGTDWSVGDACDTVFDEDGLWYAGTVVAVSLLATDSDSSSAYPIADQDNLVVELNEYGNSVRVGGSSIRRRFLPGTFCSVVDPSSGEWNNAKVVEVTALGYAVAGLRSMPGNNEA